MLTAACFAVQVEDVALLASAGVGVGGTDAVVFTAMVPQVTEINFFKRLHKTLQLNGLFLITQMCCIAFSSARATNPLINHLN